MQSEITTDDLVFFQKYLKQATGIEISDNQAFLVQSRLRSLVGRHGHISIEELISRLKRALPSDPIKVDLINSMTTNETYWFRDNSHFDDLVNVVFPLFLETHKSNTVRIWSAGCSTGQEPYSISMAAQDYAWRKKQSKIPPVNITATDISTNTITKAKTGIYTSKELSRGVSDIQRSKYFDEDGADWRVKPEISQAVSFRTFNLLDSFIGLGRFDVIFCRNVLIYFSDKLKQQILEKMASSLSSDGLLFISSTESLGDASSIFEKYPNASSHLYRLRKNS